MAKFIQVNEDMSVNLDRITKVERIAIGCLIYLSDKEQAISDIPFETMLGIISNNDEINKEVLSQVDPNLMQGLKGIVENFGQPKP